MGTDFSEEMILSAKLNLSKSGRKDIEFKVMDNLNMTVEDNYYDLVTARHTVVDAKQIYKALKPNGKLILRGVDKLDCWALKRIFNRGQAYFDDKSISVVDYENILDAGFRDVELVPLHVVEYYESKEELLALLLKTPILDNMSEEHDRREIEEELLDRYIEENMTLKGIKLIRRYYGITAVK